MANKTSELFKKLMQNPSMAAVMNQMYNSMGTDAQAAFASRPNFNDYAIKDMTGLDNTNAVKASPDIIVSLMESLSNNPNRDPSSGAPAMGHLMSNAGTVGDLGALALGAAKAHPFKTAGLVGSAAGNIGGLMDNNKFGGQLAGLGLGGLGAYALAQGNPYMAAMLTMGGGNIGALFDKLRAKKEVEQSQGIPNAGNPIAMMQRR